jgi:ribosome modulation factor
MTHEPDLPEGVYAEGRASFAQGWPRQDCPYPPDADEREEWLRGWDDAAADRPSDPGQAEA